MSHLQTTLGNIVRAVQDVTASDEEVVAVIKHMFASKRAAYACAPPRSEPHTSEAA